MSFKPKNNYLWLSLPNELKEKKSKGGIIIPDNVLQEQEGVVTATVLAVPPESDLKKKDTVYLRRAQAKQNKMTIDGKDGILVLEGAILGVS